MRGASNKSIRSYLRQGVKYTIVVITVLVAIANTPIYSKDLTLTKAIDIALNTTGRGGIIEGNLEVAKQRHFAEKIGFYVPEVSINGSIPAYSINERYDYLPGTDTKVLSRRTTFNYNADITLKQNLITGGDISLRSNLVRNDWEYPDRLGAKVTEERRVGTFNFTLTQPLLKPSESKHLLANSRDDLDIARLRKIEETVTLRNEIVEAYFGSLRSDLMLESSLCKLESVRLKAAIDSVKLSDGIIAEEDWLETSAALLDAELAQFEAESIVKEQIRDLNALLDYDASEELVLQTPEMSNHPSDNELQEYAERWDASIPIKKAGSEFDKSERHADYVASSHGLTADISANYGLERGNVEDNRSDLGQTNLETDSWGVSLDFTFPLWDGGASSASVKAARLAAEQSRLEYEKVQKSARADIVNLINQLDVSYRKLNVLKQKVATSELKLAIARDRLDNGQISMLTFLENKVSFIQAKDDYLEEIMNYFLIRFELEGKYTS